MVSAIGALAEEVFGAASLVIRCPDEPSRDVAFAGGIDLCHSRRDDAEHGAHPEAPAHAADQRVHRYQQGVPRRV